jgi:4-oxalocrotonate tautomerase
MPYINLRIAGTANKEQKEEIAKQFSQTLLDVLGKPKDATYLVIDEVPRENWAKGETFLA